MDQQAAPEVCAEPDQGAHTLGRPRAHRRIGIVDAEPF
jgi:hypothetical protein